MLFALVLLLLEGQVSYSIRDVRIEGMNWWDQQTILGALNLRKGQSINQLSLRNALKNAYLKDYFKDLSLRAWIESQKVDIILEVKENPKLKEMTFEGMRVVKPSKVKDTLGIKQNIPVSNAALFKVKNFIMDQYKSKGYYGTTVNFDISPPEKDGSVSVLVKVNEGNKARIAEILFHGNNSFPATRLKRVMKTKEKKFIIFSGKFDEEKFQEDINRLKEFYQNNGYPDVKIDSFRTETSGNKLYVHVYLKEGRKHYFGNVTVQGNEFFKEEDLLKVSKIKEGAVYSQKNLNKTIEGLSSLYGDSGFLYVNITPFQEAVRDSFIDLKLYVFEGPRIRVRKIDITGNTKTYDEVIRRELDVLPGEYFSREKLIKSQRDLYYMNFFDNVEVNFKPTEDSGYVDLIFKVSEKYTGNVGLGATYSQLDGLSLYFQIQQPNFRGKGEIINFLVEYGFRKRNFQISFTEPWLFGKKQQAGFSLYSLTTYYPQYTVDRNGGNLSYGKRIFNDYWKIYAQYSLEKTNVHDIDSSLLSHPYYRYWSDKGWQWSSAFTYNLSFDNRDRVFNATKGNIFSYKGEVSGGPLRGDIHFVKQEFELSKLIPETKTFISAFSLKTGYIRGIYHPDSVPFYERFFLGDVGTYGLRGYELNSVGPIENNVNIGGRLYFIFSLEQRYRLNDNMYLLAFFDAGNAFKNANTLRPFIVKKGVGIGIRMEIPLMGIIGFDFAYGIDSKKWVPHIQVGTSF